MKRIFTLIALAAITWQAKAQQKWDFNDLTATMAEVATDKTNWEVDKTESDGTVSQYHYISVPEDKTVPYSLQCNGKNLAITDGLLFTGITKTKAVVLSTHAKQHYLKLNASSMKMIIPNLKKGQTVTIIGRSGTSGQARGLTADQNLTVVSGFEANTDDPQTNVATVVADGDVVIGQTASMNLYSIEVTGTCSGDDNPTVSDTRTWDFSNLTETFTLLASDTASWAVNRTESDGRVSEYDNKVRISSSETLPITYNDGTGAKNLPVADGLLFSNASVGKLLFSTRRSSQHFFKLNGSNVRMIIPNVAAGSTITVELEGASTTEARGLNVSDNVTPTTGNFNNPAIGVQTDEGTVNAAGDVVITSTAGVNIFKITVVAPTTDGISQIKPTARRDGKAFNLSGQMVDSSYKGVVIANGRKYVSR